MAGNIKGITIEIGGDTTGLDKALRGVNKQSKDLQSELKQVDNLLKFNPGNTDLIAQKQKLLAEQVATTTDKLSKLKEAQSQVDDQFASGKIDAEQYRAFQREVVATEGVLNGLQNKLSNLEKEQQSAADSTKQLGNLFAATGTNIDEYANTLGINLVNAIKNGTASSKQLDTAISKIGQEALGTGVDIDKLKQAISQAGDGASLKSIKKELGSISDEAENAADSVKGMGSELAGIAGGLAVGGGIAGVVSKALDTSSLNTKIDISFDVTEESKASVHDAINTVSSYGIDAEAALEGVRRQWTLNKDASDDANSAVVAMAGTITTAFSGVDFTELIQEGNEIAATLGITNEEALGLVNTLLKAGFPSDQIDIIAEYGDQMMQAGFTAQEVQSIMSAGVDTKSWSIDNLLDGIKEGRIQMADFGSGLDKSMKEILSQTDISASKFVDWGQAIAKGGEGGQKAMLEATKALAGVEDATVRNQLGTKMFGTMWEDQGMKIVDTIIKAEGKTVDLQKGIENVNDANKKIEKDPIVSMNNALKEMNSALRPVLTSIAELVTKIALWVQNNPTLAATIAAIVSAIGILAGVFMTLSPLIAGITTAIPIIGTVLGALAGPIGIAIAAIVALVAAGVGIYKNWDGISEFFVNLWDGIKNTFSTAITAIIDFIKNNWQIILAIITGPIGLIVYSIISNWDKIKSATSAAWSGIKDFLSNLWTDIKTTASNVWDGLKTDISNAWNSIKTTTSTMWNAIKTAVVTVWDYFKTGVSVIFHGIKTVINNAWNSIKTTTTSVWNAIKTAVVTVWNYFLKGVSVIFHGIKTVITNVWNGIKSVTSSVWNGIKSLVTNVWNGIKSATITAVNAIKNTVSNIFNRLKSIVSTAMNNVKSAIETGWNKAKSFLQNISLVEIGKNIIEGLVKGINTAKEKIASAVKKVANGIPEKFKQILGIHSPSRVMRDDVGWWISEGLAKGIEANTKAEKVAKAKAQRIVKEYQAELKSLDTKYNAGTIGTSKYISGLKSLQKEYKNVYNANATIQGKINKAQEKDEQAKQKARQAALKERFARDKTYYSNKSKLDSTSMQEELDTLNKLSQKYKKNSDERIYFENLAKQKKEEITAAKKKIDEDYLSKVKELNEKYSAEEKRLTEEYKKTVADRTKSLIDFAGIFDEVTPKEVDGNKLLENLRGQVSTFKEWQGNMEDLASKGVTDELLKQLRDMGPKASAEIAALTTLTEGQLTEYVALWKEKNQLASDQALKELEDMNPETNGEIDKLKASTATKLGEYQEEWRLAMVGVRGKVKNEFKGMPSLGANAVQGLIDGMNSKKTALEKVSKELASLVASTTSSELDIHSPSRVMKKLGEYTNEGFIIGLQQSAARLKSAMSDVYGSLASNAQNMISNTNITNNSTTINSQGPKKQNITILMDSEVLGQAVVSTVAEEIVLRVGG